jgi:hypothetical protein
MYSGASPPEERVPKGLHKLDCIGGNGVRQTYSEEWRTLKHTKDVCPVMTTLRYSVTGGFYHLEKGRALRRRGFVPEVVLPPPPTKLLLTLPVRDCKVYVLRIF